MKLTTLLFVLLATLSVHAEKKMKMNFKSEDVAVIAEQYSKASGQKFIIDPSVRGKVTIILPSEVSLEEAFQHLSTSLALHGYGISTQGDTMVIRPARSIQRDLIEVSTQVPSLKPERMYSWVYKPQNTTAENILKQFRNITSKDGDINAVEATNQLIVTDWVSNINRIAALLKEIDIKPTKK